MEHEKLIEKVVGHDYALEKVATAVESLAETGKQTNTKLEHIALSMGKQEVILEKISNMDDKFKDSTNRIHSRIDAVEAKVDNAVTARESKGCPIGRDNLLNQKNMRADVEQLKDDRRWLTRIVIGKVIIIVLGAVFVLTKG